MDMATIELQKLQKLHNIEVMLGTLLIIVTIAFTTWMITKYIEGGE